MANQGTGKAASEIPALKPDWGKPTVRNFREGDGNSGIIEARQAPLPYPTILGGGDGNRGIIRSPQSAIVLPDGCWLNLVACERPSRKTGKGGAS
jgi:hypothetical protein